MNRKRRKAIWLEYRAAIRSYPVIHRKLENSDGWPGNNDLLIEFNQCCNTITRGEMVLGMKAVAWKLTQRGKL